MASLLPPAAGESLSDFLVRIMGEGVLDVSVAELAAMIAKPGDDLENLGRKIKRWRSGKTSTLARKSAAALTAALGADFHPFTRNYNGNHNHNNVRAEQELQDEVRGLSAQMADVRERLGAVERRLNPDG